MINLALTMLPIFVTFGVAAWISPASEVQPRSALRGGNPTARPPLRLLTQGKPAAAFLIPVP